MNSNTKMSREGAEAKCNLNDLPLYNDDVSVFVIARRGICATSGTQKEFG